MKTRDVLIIGAGIAGCAVALALVRRGIAVTMVTSAYDERVYHSSFIQHDRLEEGVRELQQIFQEDLCSSRAFEQLVSQVKKSADELLKSNYLVDRNGNVDIHRCLKEQLEQYDSIEWLSHHTLIELLTLDQHSLKRSDTFKKPACLGGLFFNQETNSLERILAKETLLATGGAASLYPYSTHPHWACGQGLAIANRAGVRTLNMEQIQFHPLGLYEKGFSTFPLPTQLLEEGGVLYAEKGSPLEGRFSESEWLDAIYLALRQRNQPHLWLDLTSFDPAAIQTKYPAIDAYCHFHGFNIASGPLPVVPVASFTCGGIAVDKHSQTNIQRLRAIGEVACTGLFCEDKDESMAVLESLTWAVACAEDIVKQLSRFVYYFPELREELGSLESNSTVVQEDWTMLRQVMWSYVGIHRSRASLERAKGILEQLLLANIPDELTACSIDQIQLLHAIQTAQLITHSALAKWSPAVKHTCTHIFLPCASV